MYKHRSRRKKTFVQRYAFSIGVAFVGVVGASIGLVSPAASGVDSNARVFTEGLNIDLDRSSPAFAALEDAWAPTMTVAAANEPSGRDVELNAGENSGAFVAERVLAENRREEALATQARGAREAMTRALAQAATQALNRMAASFGGGERAADEAVAREPAEVADARVATQPARTISLSDLKMSREELLSSLFFPIAQSAGDDGAGSGGETVIAAAGGRVFPRRPSASADGSHASVHLGGNSHPKPRLPHRDGADDAIADQQGFHSDVVPAADSGPVQPTLRQVTVSGSIQFTGGLALSNSMDRLVIYRDVDGEQLESGAVWLREARYEIFVEENVGLLIGELRTTYGDVIGRGQLDLSRLPVSSPKQRTLGPATLNIHPVMQGISGRVRDILSERGSMAVASADVTLRDLPFATASGRDGHYELPNLTEGSSAIIRAQRPGYWGTLAFAHAGAQSNVELFSNKDNQMIYQLLATSGLKTIGEGEAIIWGRVAKHGRSVAGVRVELMTTNDVVRPVYFNSALVPDPTLTETSANGLYAFFPVPTGAHAIRAVLVNDEATDPVVFPTESRLVSRVDVETSMERKARVKVFDAFHPDYPLAAELSSPGSSRGMAVGPAGVTELKYAEGRGMLILDSVATNPAYETVRISLSRDRHVIYVPMIQSAWLESVRGSLRLSREPETGNVVGFVQGTAPYRIALEERSVTGSSRVVYFNAKGEPTGREYGEPGGGFVILNVPEGFRTVTVQTSGSPKVFSAVTLVESKVTNVVNHWLK